MSNSIIDKPHDTMILLYTTLLLKRRILHKKGEIMMNEIEKKERVKEQNRKAVKKYREKTVSFAVKYSAVDAEQGKRLKAYLTNTGQSANSYIKALIKRDLDSKGIECPGNEELC